MTSLLDRSLSDVRKSRETDTARPVFGKPKPAPAPSAGGANDRWTHDMYSSSGAPPAGRRVAQQGAEARAADPGGRLPNLLITNLQYEVSEAELQALFSQIGKIAHGPAIKWNSSGRNEEGLAYIGYDNETYAEQAMQAFNGAPAKGQKISLSYVARPPIWAKKALGLFDKDPELLGRIQGGARDQRRSAAASPYSSTFREPRERSDRGGIASRGSLRGSGPGARGASTRGATRGGRGGRGRGGGGRGGSAGKGTTAADLDKELEAFMQEPGGKPAQDVEMEG